ncbi:hypothetical protein [Synechococcus sp. MIT S9507]|uniref:hypothetical protein n=1 Tax=Synechococcus sp. MIT S9507 TaxID=3082544 RepID=UPI0039B48249
MSSFRRITCTAEKQSGADQRKFCDVSPCIGGPAHQTNDTSRSVGALNTAAQDNRGLICIASEITETAINLAGLEAKKAVDEGMEDLLSILYLGLEVMSIDEKALAP